ncbi:proline-, glutamic acid- and leucine-rich protein 1 [Bombina bombina]|uniref:proline-, glutamic acid- and leucine-rich protein 1 n=1 Tax=Bombina bombina TaxID=8345 RepID=UPI00235A579B|nr:proline-, glutamic acid- and leucine-rich protein 1 [Bombina bombina]
MTGAKMAAVCAGIRMMEAAVTGLMDRDLSEGELGEAIQGIREHGALRVEGSSAALSGLLSCCSSRLMSASTRIEGLSLLSLVVEESPTDVFQTHCVSWIRNILQVIQSQDPPRVIGLAVFVLRSLLAHSSALPELSREVSTNQIPGLLTSLLGLRRQCLIPALEGIRSCLISYPRACGSLRGKLTVFFLSLLDAENVQIQELACQCFSLLPSLGSGFSQGVKHTENWERQIQSVLCSLHSVFKQLYQGAETDSARYDGPGTELELPPLAEDGAHNILQLLRRFTALGQCVCLLLRDPFPSPVRVPVSDILSLVCRAVNVSPKNLSWQGEESLKLLFLPRIQKSILDILDALIIACGPRLLSFSSVICRLFPQLLSSWAAVRGAGGMPAGHEKPYSSLRGSVYHVLERWVTVCGVSSGVMQGPAHHSDVLLAHLLSDITPTTESLKISGFVQHGAKKQKVSEIADSDFQNHRKRDVSTNSELCAAALRGLCCIILHCGSLIKEDTHRRLQELSIPLLIRLQQGSDNWLGPYFSSNCRKELYRLLLCLTLTPCPRLPAPLHCAIKIFRGGVTEESLQVSLFCTEALAICRVLIHPRVPSLQRPLPTPSPRPPPQTEDVSILRPPAPLPTFPVTPTANHLPVRAPAPLPNDAPLAPAVPSPPPEETFGGKTRRAVFIHYEKEEASDVEISLESDSDDSVVIVPEGLFTKPPAKSEPSPPSAKPPQEEPAELPAQTVVPPPITAPPPPCVVPAPVPAPQLPAEIPPQQPPEGTMTVININSSDDEEGEEEEEEEEGEYDEEEDFYDEEEEDLEELEEEYDEDEEGLTEEEEEDLEEDGEDDEEEDEGEDEEGLMHEELQMGCVSEELDECVQPIIQSVEPIIQNVEPMIQNVEPMIQVTEPVILEAEPVVQATEPEEGPPRLSPVQEEDAGDTGLLMLVESEEQEATGEEPQDRAPETETAESPPPPPVLTPPPPPALPLETDNSTGPQTEPLNEPGITPAKEEPEKEKEEREPEKAKSEEIEDGVVEADADTMLADFVDCPPDDEKPSERDT